MPPSQRMSMDKEAFGTQDLALHFLGMPSHEGPWLRASG